MLNATCAGKSCQKKKDVKLLLFTSDLYESVHWSVIKLSNLLRVCFLSSLESTVFYFHDRAMTTPNQTKDEWRGWTQNDNKALLTSEKRKKN